MDSRRDYIYSQIYSKDARILELGPLNRPLFEKKEYPNVFTADVRSTEEVKQLYGNKNRYLEETGIHVDIDTIVDIDFVIKDSYAKTFGNVEKFDYIVASHVLEHIPDLIGWFQDATSVLNPNGRILLVYPDKRYCFDRFRECSTFSQLYQVHQGKEPAIDQRIIDFLTNVVDENDPIYWWMNQNTVEHLPEKSIDLNILESDIDDIHYWPFSPTAFLKFLHDMERAGMSDYVCTDFRDTCLDDQQFYVTLKKKTENEDMATANKRLRGFMQQSLQNQSSIVQEALEKADAMKRETQRVYVELDKTYQALRNDSLIINEAQRALQISGKREQELEEQLNEAQSALQILRKREKELEEQLNEAKQQTVILLNSTSWKLTKPFRILFSKLRNMIKTN